MRWPFTPFKIDSFFDQTVSYGPHEGLDINGLGGGNTDCGTPLFPLADGEIVHTSESTKDYGNMMIFEITGPWGIRWIRYAHCQKFLKMAGKCSEKEAIALMGSTGNSNFCHLHFDVIKKKPANWRYYTKNKDLFYQYFEDPKAFIEKWMAYVTPMPTNPVLDDQQKGIALFKSYRSTREQGPEGNWEGYANALIGHDRDFPKLEEDLKNAKVLEVTDPILLAKKIPSGILFEELISRLNPFRGGESNGSNQ